MAVQLSVLTELFATDTKFHPAAQALCWMFAPGHPSIIGSGGVKTGPGRMYRLLLESPLMLDPLLARCEARAEAPAAAPAFAEALDDVAGIFGGLGGFWLVALAAMQARERIRAIGFKWFSVGYSSAIWASRNFDAHLSAFAALSVQHWMHDEY